MSYTDQQLETIMRAEMKVARRERRRLPFKDAVMPVRITLLLSTRTMPTHTLQFESVKQKHDAMWKMACLAKLGNAKLLMIATDTCMLEAVRFSKYFGLKPPDTTDPASVLAFQHQYAKIRDERFGGWIENMPPELWESQLCVCVKGPETPVRSLRVTYIDDGFNRPLYDPMHEDQISEKSDLAAMGLVPDWWEIADADPNYLRTAALVQQILAGVGV